MANFILDYNLGIDSYSDGDVEDIIYHIVKEGRDFEQLTENELIYPVVYHLSNIRENILLWYNFDPNANALEIGSGCGAITGLLCRKLKHVTSVELSKRRAEINYERNKKYDNLDLIVSNFNDLKIDAKFEYIILNGVYEYASSYTHSINPYVDFLTTLSAFLCPGGKILIAIENRLGAKYFAGAPEDHLDTFFTGINGYPGVDSVKTFSKQEMQNLCRRAGFEKIKFYYPYPDYKFPNEIFTDKSINSPLYGRKYNQYNKLCFDFINESHILKNFAKEGVADVFANSFLIEICENAVDKNMDEEIIYVKLNSDRNENFQIYTKIWKNQTGLFASKCPISHASQDHINKMKRVEVSNKTSYKLLKSLKTETTDLIYPLLREKSLDSIVVDALEFGNYGKITQIIQKVYETFLSEQVFLNPYKDSKFKAVFGNEQKEMQYNCVTNINFDIILDNIFLTRDEFVVIDYEWMFDFYIPSEYIMWRLINELYFKHSELYNFIDRRELELKYGIKTEFEEIFRSWENAFAYHYVGSNKLRKIAKEETHVNLEKIAKLNRYKFEIESRLYIDFGDGFSEKDVMVSLGKVCENHFQVEFVMPSCAKPYRLRWDPIDEACICKDINAFVDGKIWNISPSGAIVEQDRNIFLTQDPYFIFSGEFFDAVKIYIEGEIFLLDEQQFSKYIRETKEKEREREKNIVDKDELIAQQTKIIEEKDELVARQTGVIKEKDELVAYQTKVITEKDALIANQIAEITLKDELIVNQSNEIEGIKMSRLWLFYRVRNYLKRRFGKKEEIEPVIAPSAQYAIDMCNYNGQLLLLKGWIFMPDRRIDQLFLCAETGTARGEVLIEIYPQSRPDVKNVFQNEFAFDSGFQLEAELEFDGEVIISLKACAQNDIQVFEIGRFQKRSGKDFVFKRYCVSLKKDLEELLIEKNAPFDFGMKKIDVIVPIYNGYEYLAPLFKGLLRTKWDVNYYLIDDKSTDMRVRPLMEAYAQENDKVHLIYNDENLGFVKTVNKGLQITENHVAIVNTDVELPEFWLERLMWPIILNNKIASTTPFSNSATIFSFPNFCENNSIYHNLNVDELDNYFKRIAPQYTIVPTGMGFCMGMNREVIQAIGILDDITFLKGYGEENDWCQRAIKAGYDNVHVENLFVYHKHGGSFLTDEKQKLLDENSKKLVEKHPNYFKDVAEYCSINPVKHIRNLVRFLIDVNQDISENYLVFDHNWGGGASAYVEQQLIEWNRKRVNTAIVRYDFNKENYKFQFINQEFQTEYELDKLEDLKIILQYMVPNTIYINELVSYPKLFQTLLLIKSFAAEAKARLIMLMHDYFPLCPSINLLSPSESYCQEGNYFNCSDCFTEKGWESDYGCSDVEDWHTKWYDFLLACDETRTFSEDSFKKVKKVYPDLVHITLVPHQVTYMPVTKKKNKFTSTVNIGLLGVLTVHKGREIIKQLLEIIKDKETNIKIILIGIVDDSSIENDKFFEETGNYSIEQLPEIILEKDIDFFFIPSIWPETFSYTTEEIIKMGLPIVAYNIGAPAERIKKYNQGYLLKDMSIEGTFQGILSFIDKLGLQSKIVDKSRYILFIAEYISFSSRYRVEHTREELFFAGINSRFIEVDELQEFCDYNNIEKVVIYRCRYKEPLSSFIEKIRENIPIIYDIDDYIFSYDNIKGMKFLEGAEYEEYEKYSSAIEACMEKCRSFITSTGTLAHAIKRRFPGKEVLVNRNVASMAMYILSQKALKYKANHGEKIILGYFSGSQTHNSDFEMIEDALVYVMKEYSNVKLLIVGCLELSLKFKPFWERIEQKEFLPWQQLPKLIAEVDINLMPLESTFFNECKSENKWMEAALVKTMTIASINSEISKVVKDNENIILCRNSIEDWSRQLSRMITNSDLRKTIADNAYQYVYEHKITATSYKEIADFLK